MPAKEIKELRQAGKLEEALNLAKAELQAEPDNIWPKRNISWVYYDFLKQNSSSEHFDVFIKWLDEIKNLQLPVEEKMLFEQLCWQIGKMTFSLLKETPIDLNKSIRIFEAIETFDFPKPTEGYSFLFKALHKALKETDKYIHFADWWGFENFMPADFEKEKLPNGREMMAIAEQAYIAYSKHLLPNQTQIGETIFDRAKAEAFLPILSQIVENYPNFQYPAYFKAKLLLALGDAGNILGSLLPFARKKRNDFWVWQILAEAFPDNNENVFACYCKALSCKAPEVMLVSLRQKMAAILIEKQYFNEARTEIELLIAARNAHEFKIPFTVQEWQAAEWYQKATPQKSNLSFYKPHISQAESLLYNDIPEETIIVEFVNKDKKMLNFISSQEKIGFFKYVHLIKEPKIGDTYKVRFQAGILSGLCRAYTIDQTDNLEFKSKFLKNVEGQIRINDGNQFGFIDDIYVTPQLISKYQVQNEQMIKGKAMKNFNEKKKEWRWKLIDISK